MSVGGSRKETVSAVDRRIRSGGEVAPTGLLIVEPASDSRDVSGDFQMTKSARVQALRGVA
jgi:hypothetical protein